MANWLNKTFYTVDYNVAKFFHQLQSHGGKPMTLFWEIISYLGAAGIAMILVGLILCIFTKTRRIGLTTLFSIGISAIIVSLILKPLIARDRPFVDANSDFYLWWLKAGKTYEPDYSFPSGHSTASMAFALSIFISSKKKRFLFPILIFPILMASSRIYLMVHFFSDCIFGLVVGALCALLAYYITHLLFNKTKGKFNNFINNFKLQDLFTKRNKNNSDTDLQNNGNVDDKNIKLNENSENKNIQNSENLDTNKSD